MSKKKRKDENPVEHFILSELYKAFNQHPNRSFNHKQLARHLREPYFDFIDRLPASPEQNREELGEELRNEIIRLLGDLAFKGELIEVERGKFKLKPKHSYLEGIIDITASGAAFLLSENDEDDVFIAPRNVRQALHGDRVKVFLYAKHRNQRIEGEVVEVLERARTEFVGTVQLVGKYAFVVPDSPKMLIDIFIPGHLLSNAEQGQKVMAEIVDWPKNAKNPMGRISRVLGWPGENDAEMHSILAEYGFPLEFPAHVEKESEAISEEITPQEIRKRRDFRSVPTFTIDPIDAKDFDDALSIQPAGEGRWEIGIHIADVTHYIREHTRLDKEAYERATSVYLVDRTIPMLPEKLSNGVCSLRPGEDKLCFSVVVVMDEHAKVHDTWFGKTVIFSDKRFHYDEAQAVIETGQGPFSEEIGLMHRLAQRLRTERFRKGAIAFEKVEVKFQLDEQGRPIGVYLKESKDANKLIEEFMLLANRSVAEFVGKRHRVTGQGTKKGKHQEEVEHLTVEAKPFVYRVHEGPVNERLQSFAAFAGRWGYQIKTGNDREIAHSLNDLMKSVRGKKEQNVLEQLAIRSMSKAVYTTDNVGHYGLAFDYYTHFTSPIRRYPDVLVHRLLERYLASGQDVDVEALEEQCKHCTAMEIKASDAERTSIKYKQVEFLQDKLGQTFDGIISGVTEWGLYVELSENKCEGLVRLRELEDDFYEFDDTNLRVIGSRTGRVYSLGDAVRVTVLKADLQRRQIDFRMERNPEHHTPLMEAEARRSSRERPGRDGFRAPKKAKKRR